MQTTNRSFAIPTIASALAAIIIAAMFDMRFHEMMLTALLGALAAQWWNLSRRINELEDHIVDAIERADKLQRTAGPAQPVRPDPVVKQETQLPAAAARTTTANADTIIRDRAENTWDDRNALPSTSTTNTTASTSAKRHAYVPPPPSAFELQLHAAWNWLKTRNPIALAAVTISFLGGVFLVKYAAEHSHFPIEYRFIGLSLVTLSAIVVGWRIRARNAAHVVFAQVLQGGGIAGLYLTVFAATRLYSLLPASLAFVLMVGVAIAAAILAVAQNALPLAIVGTTGGFLTPLLLSTGGGSHIALFTYYALLNLGVFIVAWFRTWRALNVLSFAFTFSITALWRSTGYQQQDLFSTDLFLLLFFLMFIAIAILNAVRQPPDLKGYVSGSLVFGLPVAAFSLHASLVQPYEYALAYSALGVALFYCGLAWALYKQAKPNFRLLIEAFAALAVIFASLAIPLAFDRHVTAAMWSFEGAGMIWLGLSQQRKLPRFFGALLQVSAGISYLHALALPAPITHEAWPIINGVYIGSILLCGVAWFSAWLLHVKGREQLASYEQQWPGLALWVGCGWWLLGGLHEIDAHLHVARIGAILIHAVLGACLLWYLSQRWLWRLASVIALLAPALGVFIAITQVTSDSAMLHPCAYGGLLGWPLLFATQYWLLWRSDKCTTSSSTGSKLINTLHTASYLLLACIATWECAWQVSQQLSGVWTVLPVGIIPTIMLWSLTQRFVTARWPIAQHPDCYRIYASVVLAAFIALWLFATNVSNAGDPFYIAYIPLLNPLDITCMLLFLGLVKWWQALDAAERDTCWPLAARPIVMLALLVFVWMNAALIRTLHYLFDVPLTAAALFDSTLVQTSLSIFWMVLAMCVMLFSSRRALRVLWKTGFGLMVVVIAKLFLVDLPHTGTLARIISFLTVGGLLFVISYFSPLPPQHADNEVSAE